MEIEEHYKKFIEIIKKYNLDKEETAEEITDYLFQHNRNYISTKEFSERFNMKEDEAKLFLSFIEKGISFFNHTKNN